MSSTEILHVFLGYPSVRYFICFLLTNHRNVLETAMHPLTTSPDSLFNPVAAQVCGLLAAAWEIRVTAPVGSRHNQSGEVPLS